MSTEQVTDYLRPSPVYDGPGLTGYQVFPGVKSGSFAKMGLQAGDLVTSVDGAPFSDPDQAAETFRELLNGAVLSITVTRKGRTERLTLDGSVILKDQEREKQAASARTGAVEVPGT
jgi:type II secretion system protein C